MAAGLTRVMLIGAAGFVGPYVFDAIRRVSDVFEIIPTAKTEQVHRQLGHVFRLDVTDLASIKAAIGQHYPTHIINLAGISAPAIADGSPHDAWNVHLNGTINLAEVMLELAPACCLIHVSTGLAYGASANLMQPISEQAVLAPLDVYSASKACGELALGPYSRRGLKCVRLRPFNHTGAGQSTDFAVPAFANQIARIEAGLVSPDLYVGNLSAERDFLDVRDVAAAYALTVLHSEALETGEILNISSGIPRKMRDVLDDLLLQSCAAITIHERPAGARSSDLRSLVGDSRLARKRLGWSPEQSFVATLADVLNHCRAELVMD